MKRFLLLFYLLVLGGIAKAQHNYQMPLGIGEPTADIFGYSTIDFRSEQIQITGPHAGNGAGIGVNSSFICDKVGNLILMTNNCSILDRTGNIVPNGDSLNPGYFFNNYCQRSYPGSTQNLFLPSLQHSDLYLLLHKDTHINTDAIFSSQQLYLTIIQSKLNNHDILSARKVLRDSQALTTMIAAIPHTNKISWWVLELRGFETNEWLKYSVSADSIEILSSQYIGPHINTHTAEYSQIVFSPDGNKVAMYVKDHGLSIYNFNRDDGQLNLDREFSGDWMIESDSTLVEGYCFSPNSKILYITNAKNLYQIDLSDDQAKVLLIDQNPRLRDPINNFPSEYGDMVIGPDCRIYMSSRFVGSTIHVIHNPNELGQACNFERQAIKLPTLYPNYLTRTAFAHLGLGTELCDSSINFLTDIGHIDKISSTIYPNPTYDNVTVQFEKPFTGKILVNDIYQQNIYSQEHNGNTSINLDLTAFTSGVYFIHFLDESSAQVSKAVIKM